METQKLCFKTPDFPSFFKEEDSLILTAITSYQVNGEVRVSVRPMLVTEPDFLIASIYALALDYTKETRKLNLVYPWDPDLNLQVNLNYRDGAFFQEIPLDIFTRIFLTASVKYGFLSVEEANKKFQEYQAAMKQPKEPVRSTEFTEVIAKCPTTGQPVKAVIPKDTDILCLHRDNRNQEMVEIMNFLNNTKVQIKNQINN